MLRCVLEVLHQKCRVDFNVDDKKIYKYQCQHTKRQLHSCTLRRHRSFPLDAAPGDCQPLHLIYTHVEHHFSHDVLADGSKRKRIESAN